MHVANRDVGGPSVVCCSAVDRREDRHYGSFLFGEEDEQTNPRIFSLLFICYPFAFDFLLVLVFLVDLYLFNLNCSRSAGMLFVP